MKNTFERELAEMERIGGIRIQPCEAKDGTLYMDALIALAGEPTSEPKPCFPLPPFLKPAEFPESSWWLAVLLMVEILVWMVR